jgi:eukaryotic-like serine/threonine-protein kinase
MPLVPGTQLGPYEITASLGAGGMGEVYRARDMRLERTVAIKTLPAQFSFDPVRKQRFEREAKTISSLNHPHICVLHDIGHQDGIDYLVMECVEGETVAKRLEKGPLPLEQVLRFGTQIADALDKAHRSGVVHRDLKPGNIMLTPTGTKLLDFGLAKPAASLVSGATLTAAVTQTTPMTQEGTVVGTFQYMSPEQVEGKDLDGRSDIFSLGAVLYEMLIGKRAFQGKSQLSVASAILEKDPTPIAAIKPMTPPALDYAIKKCLAKLPDERWQSASDLASELKWITESGSQAGQPSGVELRRMKRERIAWLAASLLLVAALVTVYYRRPVAPTRPTWSYILPSEKTAFSNFGGPVAVSPDGQKLAFVARTAEGVDLLWVRPLDAPSAQPIAGTEGAFYPFWSPDNQSLGFFAGGKLKTVSALGGPALTLCDATGPRGATWGGEGTILFALTWGGLQSVPASGGLPVAVTRLDASRSETSHRWPNFLPDGRHFFYLAANFTGGPAEAASVYLASLDLKENKLLFHARSNVAYTSGYLLFAQQGTLMARPFDEKRLELKGEAFPVAEHVLYNQLVWRGVFSASGNGVLAYMGGATGNPGQLFWFDRSGKQLQGVGGPGDFSWHEVSPDGQRVAVQTLDSAAANYQIGVYDLSRGTNMRLTFGPWRNQAPVWSPDSQTIAYGANQKGRNNTLFQRKSDGTGGEQLLTESRDNKFPTSWSADGRFIAYNSTPEGKSNSELWILPLFGDRKPFAFLQTNSNVAEGRFCPRGGWIAYSSDESGRSEVYVTSFPEHQGKWLVSQSGGSMPRWRRDGKELFYLAPTSQLMAADVNLSGSTFEVAAVHPLFRLRLAPGPPIYDLGPTAGQIGYDVSPDGQRVLVNSPAENDAAPITVILNWTAKLNK